MLQKNGNTYLITAGSVFLAFMLFLLLSELVGPPDLPEVDGEIENAGRKPVKIVKEEKIEYKSGTINGYDSATNSIINPINVFKNYENRNQGLAGKVNHGQKVTILEKSGNGVKIKTDSGTIGWVSSWFVKES